MTELSESKRRPRKAYLAARQVLLNLLNTEFNEGDQIPAERDLSGLLGISRMTLRKITDELVSSGMLERRGNQGTWLTETTIQRPLTQTIEHGISKITELNGAVAGSRLIYFQEAQASPRIAALLKIQAGDPLVMIKRLRLADGEPFCLETSYLPRAIIPDLTAEMLEQSGSLYRLLAENYGVLGVSDEGTLRVTLMNEEEQTLLNAQPHSPALVYRGVITDRLNQPVEYLVSVNHPQRVTFRISHGK
ncbi:GntR family transcriptional regulator [Rahnella aquatilis]|jgi:Transcriptional regulators|uniref:GntR family transcriptional regulator n=1 Tax=Rahnella sp. (strain Y9602) TaxID=2703885 RepID=A0A0H3F9B7_RAHSY|nr:MULTISPECIES: GntR family transcriptional regulator [Rahnella]AFE58102.1 GntR family transcriptional regulator [Rahnella aquatilis HX2]AYA06716.1 GntR family transcriptional regulator [Rahnella aquatilis]ADW73518.1 transcriptional regulator, GntR family [Rahnella aceris]AZP41957.1 GntR family transcriptional regulator [Rahnella aquatilis]AZP46298.1 GntR family transcriptional regulator [Rahnella aquatilis]